MCAVQLTLNSAVDNLQEEMLQCNDGEWGSRSKYEGASVHAVQRAAVTAPSCIHSGASSRVHSSDPWAKSSWTKVQMQIRSFLFLPRTEVEDRWVFIGSVIVGKAPLLAEVA